MFFRLMFFRKWLTLFRLGWRGLTELSPRIAWKAARLGVIRGLFALRAFRRRVQRGELFPPFLFFALTDACNLRCRGCWVAGKCPPVELSPESVDHAIQEGAKQSVYFHTFLGGEPFMYPAIWELIEKHPECYFQIITNGQLIDANAAQRIRRLGNISPLISIDGWEETNDARRGTGTYATSLETCRLLQKEHVLYGVATVVTGENFEQVLSEEYIRRFIDLGAMYLWYYVFRPMGANPSPELCLDKERILELRRRLLMFRKTMPIVLIDTYWNAKGEAVCPAARGLGFHIGPSGGIEPCPPLSVCREHFDDNNGNLFQNFNESTFLRNFQNFVTERTQGCVILECPDELADFFEKEKVEDSGGRELIEELRRSSRQASHHLPGQEMPEDFWFYRFLKKTLFFGMGGYG